MKCAADFAIATLAARAAVENVAHVTGSSDITWETVCNHTNVYKQIIEDSLYGKVSMFCKTSTNPVRNDECGNAWPDFNEGISSLTILVTLLLRLNLILIKPETYANEGNPVFFVNGCNAGKLLYLLCNTTISVNETLSGNLYWHPNTVPLHLLSVPTLV